MNIQVIREFVKELDKNLSIKIVKGESYYSEFESCVYFSPDDFNDCGFLRHLRENHKCADCNNYPLSLWTLLHEIGHYFTIDFCEQDEFQIRALCSMVGKETVQKSIPMQDMYFNLESEWEATEWAIRFVERNPDKCNALVAALLTD